VSYYHEEQTFSALMIGAITAAVALPVAFILFEALIRPGFVVPSLAALLILVPILVLFLLARLVVDVDRDEIRIGFHFLWPTRRIPIISIRRARMEHYSPLFDYGGWGVRLSPRGWAFTVGGHDGVLVETNDGKRVLIGSHRPQELEAAIARAIADRAGR